MAEPDDLAGDGRIAAPEGAAGEALPPRTPSDLEPPRPQPLHGALAHLMSAIGLVLGRPRLLFLLVALSVLLALPVALPVYRSAYEHLAPVGRYLEDPAAFDFRFTAPEWALDEWFRTDQGLSVTVQALLAPLILLASLLGVFTAAGWMHLAVHGRADPGIRAFFRGGGTHLAPFVRSWLLALALMAGVNWLVNLGPGRWLVESFVPEGNPGLAASEKTARSVQNAQVLVYLLLLLYVELVTDLGRVSMVVGGRRSAILALFRGFGFCLLEPLRVLTVVGGGIALEVLWVVGTVAVVDQLDWPLWLLVFLLPLGRIAARGVRLTALATLYAEASRSRSRPLERRASPFDDGTAWRTGPDAEAAAG